MRYLIEDYETGKSKHNEKPKLKIVYEDELFDILQLKPKGIAVTKLPDFCVIDWS